MQETQEKVNNDEQIDPKIKLKVDSKSSEIMNEIIDNDASDIIKRREITKRIDNYGVDTLKIAEERSKNFSTTVSKMTVDSTSESLEQSIEKLEKEMKTVDPSLVDFSKISKGIGKLFNPITQYFKKLEQEDENIEGILNVLNSIRNILSNDNITLELEIDKIADTIQILNLEYDVGVKIKNQIESIIEEARKDDNNLEKIKFYEDEVITPLEKKLYDIKQVIIVNEQSMLAMEIIRKNNKELIRNIDRIKNVTMVAINTAVMVAKSLYNQKVALNKIEALNNSTNDIISNTSDKLNQVSLDIANGINNAELSSDLLKQKFTDLYSLIEDVKIQNKEHVIEIKEKSKEI